MSQQKLLMFTLALTILALVGCTSIAVGPTPTLTPIPPTITPTPIPPTPTPTITPAPPPTCLKEPPPGLFAFKLNGNFEPSQPPSLALDESLDPRAWNTARQLVCDASFFIKHEQGDYNEWGGLLKVEEIISADEIPHGLAGGKKTVGTIIEEYGEPAFVGKFQMEDGDALNVYWFGPIFLMAKGLDDAPMGKGGWLSRLQ